MSCQLCVCVHERWVVSLWSVARVNLKCNLRMASAPTDSKKASATSVGM